MLVREGYRFAGTSCDEDVPKVMKSHKVLLESLKVWGSDGIPMDHIAAVHKVQNACNHIIGNKASDSRDINLDRICVLD
jgi:hypothetical protein